MSEEHLATPERTPARRRRLLALLGGVVLLYALLLIASNFMMGTSAPLDRAPAPPKPGIIGTHIHTPDGEYLLRGPVIDVPIPPEPVEKVDILIEGKTITSCLPLAGPIPSTRSIELQPGIPYPAYRLVESSESVKARNQWEKTRGRRIRFIPILSVPPPKKILVPVREDYLWLPEGDVPEGAVKAK